MYNNFVMLFIKGIHIRGAVHLRGRGGGNPCPLKNVSFIVGGKKCLEYSEFLGIQKLILVYIKKLTFLVLCLSRPRRGGLKASADMSAYNFFFTAPLSKQFGKVEQNLFGLGPSLPNKLSFSNHLR